MSSQRSAGFLPKVRQVFSHRWAVSPVATIATGGTVLAGAHSSLQTWATEVAPEARGTAVALFVTAVYGGASIAHAAVAPLASNHRFGVLFLSGVCIAVPVTAVAAVGRARFRVEPEFSVAAEATARSEGRR